MPTKTANRTLGPRLRLVLAAGVAIGPGKADLLDGIRATGSIAAAGRRQGMSYKRAWSLVEALNREYAQPLVATAKGGRAFGGATLTPTGGEVLALYRRMEAATVRAIADDLAAMRRLRRVGAKK